MYGGSQVQTRGSSKNICQYCHQQPKFPPYDYCSKACGAKAKASGSFGKPVSSHAKSSPMCKQCGQKPAFKGHQFCGRRCANTWQATYGSNSGNFPGGGGHGQPQYGQQQSWGPPSSQPQYPPGQSPGSGGPTMGGLASGFKNLVWPSQTTQRPSSNKGQFPPSGPHTQHHPASAPQNPSMIPPNTPMVVANTVVIPQNSQMMPSNTQRAPPKTTMGPSSTQMNTKKTANPGMGGQLYQPAPAPPSPGQQFYTPGSSPMMGGLDAGGQVSGKSLPPSFPAPSYMNTDGNPPSYSDDDYPDDDEMMYDPIETSDNEGDGPQFPAYVDPLTQSAGDENGSSDAGSQSLLLQQQDQTPSGSSLKCQLAGCNKPAFVDKKTGKLGQYCSKRHQEEAAGPEQVEMCIMCMKKPRSQGNHFCSKECQKKAMSA